MPAAPDPGVPVHPADATLNSLIVALATPVPTVRSRSTPAVAFTAVVAAGGGILRLQTARKRGARRGGVQETKSSPPQPPGTPTHRGLARPRRAAACWPPRS